MYNYGTEDHELIPVDYDEVKKHIELLNKGIDGLNSNCQHLLGLEGIGSFLWDVKHFFTDGLSKFIKGFGNFISFGKTVDPLPSFRHYDKSKQNYLKYSQKPEYNIKDMGIIKVPYIKGCNHSLLSVVKELYPLSLNHVEIIKSILREADYAISEALSNQDFRESKKPIPLNKAITEGSKWTKSVKEMNSKLIDPNNYVDNLSFNEVYSTDAELKEVYSIVDKLRKELNIKELKIVSEMVTSIKEKSKTFTDQLEEDEITCSKQFISYIEELYIQAGNAVSYLATYYWFVNQAVTVLNYIPTSIEDYFISLRYKK